MGPHWTLKDHTRQCRMIQNHMGSYGAIQDHTIQNRNMGDLTDPIGTKQDPAGP